MSELKPCPFCEAENTDVGFIAHTDDCYLMRRYIGASSRKELGIAWNTRPIEDELRAELARRDEIIKRLKENGERLAARPYPFIDVGHVESGTYCHYCHKSNKFDHTPDCPITTHRALMKELEGE